ncbi:MAG: rhodanese-like domain-containing protein [Pseudomonadales bacterium]
MTAIVPSSHSADKFTRISAANAHRLISDSSLAKPLKIIDVRGSSDYAKGHIRGAIHLDYRAMNFTERLQQMDKRQTYLLYCNDSGRSVKALRLMKKLGFTSVYELQGGIKAWRSKGYVTQR